MHRPFFTINTERGIAPLNLSLGPMVTADQGRTTLTRHSMVTAKHSAKYVSSTQVRSLTSIWLTSALGTNFVYGTEVPFPNSYCHGPFTCTITSTTQVQVAVAGSVSLDWLKAFGVGVSGTYTSTTQTAYATAFQIKLDLGKCGYFTFVPVRRDVWYVFEPPRHHSHANYGL